MAYNHINIYDQNPCGSTATIGPPDAHSVDVYLH